jgi:hypothetical protein
MTAEIAIMNRSAVALAADRASTVTYWEEGEAKTRYFKNANKIFNISNKYPVGLMIYDAGSIEGMPWEVVAKVYRDKRGNKPLDHVLDYANDFFDFVVSDGHLFPRAYQEDQFISTILGVVLRICNVVKSYLDDQKSKESKANASDLIKKGFAQLKEKIEEADYLQTKEREYLQKEAVNFKDRVEKKSNEYDIFETVKNTIAFDEVYDLAVTAVFKERWTILQTSGLVFAGYGENEYFPALHHYICYGILLGRLVFVPGDKQHGDISHANVSEIVPIAQSEMVDTFICGANINALVHIDNSFEEAVTELISSLKESGKLGKDVETADEEAEAMTSFGNKTADHLAETHTQPLRNVVGMLSINELAELAETLISIESLKERVTRPTETVSGPIDVAVISKSDGFIWIKRKHYFDPKLNPRFFSRRGLAREQ